MYEKNKAATNKQASNEATTSTPSIADKRVSLRAVRNFMRLGRSRHSSRESSGTEDEGKSLISDSETGLALAAENSANEQNDHTSQGTMHSDGSSEAEEATNNEISENTKNKR